MRLFLIPIEYMYGGGYSVIIKAEDKSEAKEKAKLLTSNKTVEEMSSIWNEEIHIISDEVDLGDFDEFNHAFVSYWE